MKRFAFLALAMGVMVGCEPAAVTPPAGTADAMMKDAVDSAKKTGEKAAEAAAAKVEEVKTEAAAKVEEAKTEAAAKVEEVKEGVKETLDAAKPKP